MPVDLAAEIEVTAFQWVPPFAQGSVKDLRVRWALEEIDRPYRTRLIGGIFTEQTPEYLVDQPFGQVPVYRDGQVTLFESGAILIHIGTSDARLLPQESAGRARAIAWMFAALNSIEPSGQSLTLIGVAGQGTDWEERAASAVRPFVEKRLAQLARALGDRDWLEDRFTLGDLVMVDVLRSLPLDDLLTPHPNLVAYVARGTARPAFARALAAQLADFTEPG